MQNTILAEPYNPYSYNLIKNSPRRLAVGLRGCLSFRQLDHRPAQRRDGVPVMGGEEDIFAAASLPDEPGGFLQGLRIHPCERLVQQQGVAGGQQRPQESHPALSAARELSGRQDKGRRV